MKVAVAPFSLICALHTLGIELVVFTGRPSCHVIVKQPWFLFVALVARCRRKLPACWWYCDIYIYINICSPRTSKVVRVLCGEWDVHSSSSVS